MADVATDPAVSKLNSGKLDDRHLTPGSLALQDACGLLDPSALTGSGVVPDSQEPGFGGWDCQWNAAGGRWLHVEFDQGPPPATPDDGIEVQLAGHTSFVQANGDGGDHNCVVKIPYRRFSYRGTTLAETIRVVVGGPDPSDALCAPARQLATDLAANLG